MRGQLAALRRGELDTATLYVIDPSFRPAGAALPARCGTLDGWRVCVSGSNDDPLARRLGGPTQSSRGVPVSLASAREGIVSEGASPSRS